MLEILSRCAARIGNWNDRARPYEGRGNKTLTYRAIDRVCSYFYVLPERHR